jgi:type VI secretion system protein ImpF
MNPLAGQLLSDLDWKDVEANVSRAILAFEPRVLPKSLSVTLLPSFDSLNHHNTLQFEIRCQFWSMPYPLELLLKTSLDLETGLVVLSDLRS